MSHDIPSRVRAIIAFLGEETGQGARIKALACTFISVGESGRKTKHGQAWRLLRSEVFRAVL